MPRAQSRAGDRHGFDARSLRAGRSIPGREQHDLPVRCRHRAGNRRFVGRADGHEVRDGAPGGGNPRELRHLAEQNLVVGRPVQAADDVDAGRQILGGAAVEVQPPQLGLGGDHGHRLAVRTERHGDGAIGVGDGSRFGLIEIAHIDLPDALAVADERNALTVGRDARRGVELDALGQQQLGACWPRRRRRGGVHGTGPQPGDRRASRRTQSRGAHGSHAAAPALPRRGQRRWRRSRRCHRDRRRSAGDDLIERVTRFADVAQARLRILRQEPLEQATQRRRRRRRQQRPVRLALEHAREDVGDVVAGEQALAGEHLEQHDAERPDVGALVDGPAARLLGRHVGRGAEDHAHLRPPAT